MPPIPELTALLAISGVISYGVTQVVKLLCGKWVGRDVDHEDPWAWQAAFRLVPLLIGVGVGLTFPYEFPWNVSVGCAGGILSVLVYKRVEKLIEDYRN